MPYFNIVAQSNVDTVVTEYEPVKHRSDYYQSEAELEEEFIRLLCEEGYTRLHIHTEEEMILNLRKQLETLNRYEFSDSEWERFFSGAIANGNEGIVEKTAKTSITIVCKLSISTPWARSREQSTIIATM